MEIIERNNMFNEDIRETVVRMKQFVEDRLTYTFEVWCLIVDCPVYSVSSWGRVRNNRTNPQSVLRITFVCW